MVDGIDFEDLASNYEHNYNANIVYLQSKLALVMMAYELQRRLEAAGNKEGVLVQVCHPGAAHTNLIQSSASWGTRFVVADCSVFRPVCGKGRLARGDVC
jgi:NAD(P)-dependent dehydrogenase (short-subunit alcohol dehydrogenase family)